MRFYKGSIAVLDKLEKSEFISVSSNERDSKVEGKIYDSDSDDHSALTFKDFCMFKLKIIL